MKPEARILVSKCVKKLCLGFIVRRNGIDGILSSQNGCTGLCIEVFKKGFLEELRYYLGDCKCDLRPSPITTRYIESIMKLMEVDFPYWYNLSESLISTNLS